MFKKFAYSLLFLLLYITAINAQTNTYIRKGDSLFRAKAYKEAIHYYNTGSDSARFPTLKKLAYYQIACSYAQLNNKEKALAYLDTAINQWGYANYSHLIKDEDLVTLHQEKKWKQLTSQLQARFKWRQNPRNAKLVTTDIHNFWKAYDLVQQDTAKAVAIYKEYYFDKASPGLQDYTLMRTGSVQTFVDSQKAKPLYYQSIRANTLAVDPMKEEMYKSFEKMKQLHSEAIFPDIYFVIGRLNSGGTVSDNGLLIGLDQNAKDSSTVTVELNLWEKNNTGYLHNLPGIIAHELIHFQQADLKYDTSLLSRAISEGMCDMLGELISGKNINSRLQDYADGRRLEIWNDFKNDMLRSPTNKWLYGGKETTERPADLGYYMGYEITKAYYENAKDKRQAIYDILHIQNYQHFLTKSKYEEKLLKQNTTVKTK